MSHEYSSIGNTADGDLDTNRPLAHDILRGADQIARYIFGDAQFRRKIYHLAQTENLPVFRLGNMLCARKSKLLRWIEEEEGKSTNQQ